MFLKLFWSFAQVGLFSFGGGMAAMPLIQSQVVDLHQWLTLTEFTDLVTIAEMTPGPIAVNAATFVGIRVAGLPGALIATFGCVLPSFLIVTLLAKVYFKFRSQPVFSGVLSGLRPAVVALIACAGVNMLLLALWGEAGLSSRVPNSGLDLRCAGARRFFRTAQVEAQPHHGDAGIWRSGRSCFFDSAGSKLRKGDSSCIL